MRGGCRRGGFGGFGRVLVVGERMKERGSFWGFGVEVMGGFFLEGGFGKVE